jgi:hypothetical protein
MHTEMAYDTHWGKKVIGTYDLQLHREKQGIARSTVVGFEHEHFRPMSQDNYSSHLFLA